MQKVRYQHVVFLTAYKLTDFPGVIPYITFPHGTFHYRSNNYI